MAYDEELAARIREMLEPETGVREMRMFGGLAFLVGGNMAVAASGQGGLMLRCDPARTEELVADGQASRMEMRGKQMDGWLRVDAASVDTEQDLQRWVDEGVAYARSLPPKGQ